MPAGVPPLRTCLRDGETLLRIQCTRTRSTAWERAWYAHCTHNGHREGRHSPQVYTKRESGQEEDGGLVAASHLSYYA